MSPLSHLPPFVIKVCGIKQEEDLAAAVESGANAIGFNFFRKSPRYLDPEAAALLKTPAGCLRVGVFVNASAEELCAVAQRARLDVLQLHGTHAVWPDGYRTWQSVVAGSATPAANPAFEAYLLDSPTPEFGGSGKTFDWSLAKNFPHRLILAGGLDGHNVETAIAAVRPWGVDACSRLESSPGKKDHALLRLFVTRALAASKKFLEQEVSL